MYSNAWPGAPFYTADSYNVVHSHFEPKPTQPTPQSHFVGLNLEYIKISSHPLFFCQPLSHIAPPMLQIDPRIQD